MSAMMILALSLAAAAFGASTEPISIVWPPEGLTLPAGSDGEFIFGSVSPATAPLRINGQSVPVHKTGGFLAWLPVSPGTFTFQCALDLKSTAAAVSRSIQVPVPPPVLPEKPLVLESDSALPKGDLELRAGDWLSVRARGSRGQKGRFRLRGLDWQPLAESSPGLYEGGYLVGPADRATASPVEFKLGEGWSSASAESRGKVSLNAKAPQVAAVRSPMASVKTHASGGFLMFPSSGTKLVVSGRSENQARVWLSEGLSGWLDSKDLEFLPPGTPAPRAIAGTIRTQAAPWGTSLHITLSDKAPFVVEESEDMKSLTIRFYYTTGYTNWVVYDSKDRFVREVRWKQEGSLTAAVTILLDREEALWGYQAQFDGAGLRLDLRRAPRLAPTGSPLFGLKIFLDPGHMPSATGATGPTGTKEMDANYAIAKAVEAKLSAEGAVPILSRSTTDHEVSLLDRPKLAVEKGADLFVSLHNNALPDGEDPFSKPRGFSVFYYHPHSLALAREVYAGLERHLPLPGEDLRYGNLLVARLTAMPAILIESAYMIFPDQEEKLNSPAFRAKIADGVVGGLKSWLGKERARQAPPAKAEARKAKPR